MSETRQVNSQQARRSLLKAFKHQRPVFLWGPPGIGKSELVADIKVGDRG
jgi:MoxR-like ATPase